MDENVETATETKVRKPRKAAAPKKAPKRAAKVKAKVAKASNGETKSVVDTTRYTYETSDTKTASGRKSVDVGDRVAVAMRGLDAKAALKALKDNGLKPNPAWSPDLNPGLLRMSIGNMLRKVVRGGTSVQIGDKKIASL